MTRRGRMHAAALIGLALGLGAALALVLGSGRAPPPEGPVTFVSVAEVHRLRRQGEPVLLVDVRSRQAYLARHLTGAVSIPLNALEARHQEIPRQGLVVLY